MALGSNLATRRLVADLEGVQGVRSKKKKKKKKDDFAFHFDFAKSSRFRISVLPVPIGTIGSHR